MESASAWTHNNEDAVESLGSRDAMQRPTAEWHIQMYYCITIEFSESEDDSDGEWLNSDGADDDGLARCSESDRPFWNLYFNQKKKTFFFTICLWFVCALHHHIYEVLHGLAHNGDGDGALKSLRIQIECWKLFFLFGFCCASGRINQDGLCIFLICAVGALNKLPERWRTKLSFEFSFALILILDKKVLKSHAACWNDDDLITK